MWKLNLLITTVLVFSPFLPSSSAGACEVTETAQVKLDLAKQSISTAKSLYPKCQEENSSSNCSLKDRSFAHLNAALDLISEAKLTCHVCPETKVVIVPQDRPRDCLDIQAKVSNKSGVYQIWPKISASNFNESVKVYCDMETEGGGWTVIQRRGKTEIQRDFYQDWKNYKNGFGNITQEFWLGNEKIFVITNQKNYSLRFDMVDTEGEYRYASYKFFSINDENSGYVLNIRDHSGNATDDMQGHDGQKFSTKDIQNDGRPSDKACAKMYRSAFWFARGCGFVNVNGIYQPAEKNDEKSIWWYRWKNSYECLYSVEMKIRPNGI